jgi:hypothetical protein
VSVEALSWVFQHSQATLGARLVLLALANHAHEDGSKAFPSVRTIAARAKLSERAARDALRRLEDLGEIEAEGFSEYGTVVYRIKMGAAKSADPRKKKPKKTSPTSPEPSIEKNDGKANALPSRERGRDPLFDALAVACGLRLDAIPREQARVCGVATAELRAIGVEPGDIAPAVRRYRMRYPGAAATPKAVANHWAEIAPPARAAPPCDECGVGGGQHTADCPRVAA